MACASITGDGVSIDKYYSETKFLQYSPYGGYYDGPFLIEKFRIATTSQSNLVKFTIDLTGPAYFGVIAQKWLGKSRCYAPDCTMVDPPACAQGCWEGNLTLYRQGVKQKRTFNPIYATSCLCGFEASGGCSGPYTSSYHNKWASNLNWVSYPFIKGISGDSAEYKFEWPCCLPTDYEAGECYVRFFVYCYLGNSSLWYTPTPEATIEPTQTPLPTGPTNTPTMTPSPTPSATPVLYTPLPTPNNSGFNLWVWGQNYVGQLGDGTVVSKSSFVQTAISGSKWKKVAVGYNFSAGITTNNEILTWGSNIYGNLGTGFLDSLSLPTSIGFDLWEKISCGYENLAAIQQDGTLWLWGNNAYGQIGNESVQASYISAETICQGNDWYEVSVGGAHVGAIKKDGTLWMWGANTTGQLGNPSFSFAVSSPIQTFYATNDWATIKCGLNYTLAIKNDGTAWAWGGNYGGQLGLGSNLPIISSPEAISYVSGVWGSLVAGLDFAAGLNSSAVVSTPLPTSSPTPTPTPSGTEPTSTPTFSPTVTPTPTASPAPSGIESTPTSTPAPT
jgi:hypothetical protein